LVNVPSQLPLDISRCEPAAQIVSLAFNTMLNMANCITQVCPNSLYPSLFFIATKALIVFFITVFHALLFAVRYWLLIKLISKNCAE